MGVSRCGEQYVGGAEPLLDHRLQLAGHHDANRPSCILNGFMMEEIRNNEIAGDVKKQMMKEDYRQPPITEG